LRKPRSTVYVRPGKDVTLYVPSDTSQEVCDYLNSLKEQGVFSQGVIEIISDYVQKNRATDGLSLGESETETATVHFADRNPLHTEVQGSVSHVSAILEEVQPVHEVQPSVKRRLSLSEIFNQAKKNTHDKL
jgi:hypothetical protein